MPAQHEKILGVCESCEFCGRECESGEWSVHHLHQRSTHPHLLDDPNNLMILCPGCHQFATDKRGFELYLIERFYGHTRIAKRAKLGLPARGGHVVDESF